MSKREKALSLLKSLEIPFELEEHPAVFTIGEMDSLGIAWRGEVCKNLFLRDAKGRNHYLVVLPGQKRAELKAIAAQIGSSALSFASESRLMERLGLEKGAVTPLGVVNNTDHDVVVVFDEDLLATGRVGVHPNDNTATVWLRFGDLKKLVEHCGNEIRMIRLEDAIV